MTKYEEALKIMDERFGHDCLISVATIDGKRPAVRIVNSYYEDGSFYTVTYALSNKMKQIIKNSEVAICGEWFTAHGIGENIVEWKTGYICKPSQFFHNNNSIFYADNKDIANYECEFIIKSQLEDGSWNIPWGWNGYSDE
jgi:hypothetical protein